jgi:hypothetical protein
MISMCTRFSIEWHLSRFGVIAKIEEARFDQLLRVEDQPRLCAKDDRVYPHQTSASRLLRHHHALSLSTLATRRIKMSFEAKTIAFENASAPNIFNMISHTRHSVFRRAEVLHQTTC